MPIKPIKKIKPVKQRGFSLHDYLRIPRMRSLRRDQDRSAIEFVHKKLYFDGKDLGHVINESFLHQPQLLASIAGHLEEFKKKSLKKRTKKKRFLSRMLAREEYDDDELAIIFALCDAYIKKISDLIKKRFDETKDGMSLVFDEEGQLILNSMNVHALVERCREHPTKKSLIFLKGIRSRLEHVLENKVNSRNYDRIREVVLDLFKEIDQILR